MNYKNNAILMDSFTLEGNTVGLAFDIGYEIGISSNLSIGCNATFYSGFLTNIESNDGVTLMDIELEPGEFESLHRLDFSVGLRYSK